MLGISQVIVVALALIARKSGGGWLSLFLFMLSMATLWLVPVLIFGPLISFGFVAPAAAWPLFVLADVLLLTCAMTISDIAADGPAHYLIPILRDSAPLHQQRMVHWIGVLRCRIFLISDTAGAHGRHTKSIGGSGICVGFTNCSDRNLVVQTVSFPTATAEGA